MVGQFTNDPKVWTSNPAAAGTSGLYYKHITIVNYDSSSVNKFGATLTDDARVAIYDHHMFIVQSTVYIGIKVKWIWYYPIGDPV